MPGPVRAGCSPDGPGETRSWHGPAAAGHTEPIPVETGVILVEASHKGDGCRESRHGILMPALVRLCRGPPNSRRTSSNIFRAVALEYVMKAGVGRFQRPGQLGGAMRLHADDFGCVPDGRVLTSVRVQAGSTRLDVLDGPVRPGDVGKHIAVPGAVDLVTTIAELTRRTDCLGTMTAGSDQLTAVLPHNQHFEQRVHRGLRITVAGARAGATLVTDVADVLGDTTLKLAQPAATSVSNAQTILNGPDEVKLDNHARATASAFTADLGDRAVTVAGIPVGENALLSPGAGFSSEDLTKPVTVPAAGCLFDTIEAVAGGGTSITLSAPAQRTVSDGPADVWYTDSRPGFEQLLEALSHLDAGNADICFELWRVRLHLGPRRRGFAASGSKAGWPG